MLNFSALTRLKPQRLWLSDTKLFQKRNKMRDPTHESMRDPELRAITIVVVHP